VALKIPFITVMAAIQATHENLNLTGYQLAQY